MPVEPTRLDFRELRHPDEQSPHIRMALRELRYPHNQSAHIRMPLRELRHPRKQSSRISMPFRESLQVHNSLSLVLEYEFDGSFEFLWSHSVAFRRRQRAEGV